MGRAPVTLLGDAAHAATPDLGQGACQAIERAVAIADHVACARDVEAALRDYERARMERTAAIEQRRDVPRDVLVSPTDQDRRRVVFRRREAGT